MGSLFQGKTTLFPWNCLLEVLLYLCVPYLWEDFDFLKCIQSNHFCTKQAFYEEGKKSKFVYFLRFIIISCVIVTWNVGLYHVYVPIYVSILRIFLYCYMVIKCVEALVIGIWCEGTNVWFVSKFEHAAYEDIWAVNNTWLESQCHMPIKYAHIGWLT